ncbi:MAG TPA: RNA polymerase subunit sigma [Clostridiales bacterium]|nr:RNA polymerase subunit sigma [Clostridiales bacterium]
MPQEDDKRLLNLLAQEKTKNYGFELLVKTYQERIYSIVRRMVISHEDSNDIVQDIFIKVWQNLNSFRQESSLYTWIYRIAVNESLRYLKNKKIKIFSSEAEVQKHLEQLIDNPLHFNGDQLEAKLQKAILKLPPKQRLVFNMKYYEDLTYEQMSEILGTSIGALKASYHLAIKKLEQHLDIY